MPTGNQVADYVLRLRARLRYTVGGGLVLAALFSLIVTVQFVSAGQRPFQQVGVTFGLVIAYYFVTGIAAGVVAGLLWPIGRTWPGALLVGYLVVAPVWFITGLELGEPLRVAAHGASVLSLAFGPPLGFYVWYLVRKQAR